MGVRIPLPAVCLGPTRYDETFVEVMETQYFRQSAWSRLRLRSITKLVDPQPGEKILDIGSAIGAQAHHFSTFGCETVGVDLEPLFVEKARSYFPDIEFHVGNAAELPFADASFDKVVAADLTEHVDDETLAAIMKEAHRVLVEGGKLAVYTPNPKHLIERLKDWNFLLAQNPLHIGLRDASTLSRSAERADLHVERNTWAPSPWLRWVELVLGRFFETFRYRICLLATKPMPRAAATD
ncbi:MAG TPA: methyltransferase domain-containing protein [Gaiellaceae bacterium]|nr:methyltransferase domain-containing protein [Gaiellaceae bacterium]